MRSSVTLTVLATQILALGVAAHGFDWVDDVLDDCFSECLSNTSDGCSSQKCICDASQNYSYLSSAVECAVAKCDAGTWDLVVNLLGPAQIFCDNAGNKVPESIVASAYACATVSPSTTRKTQQTAEPSSHKTTNSLTATVTGTLTQTTTDKDGNTLYVLVPIVMGPTFLSTGETITKTMDGKSSATSAPSSAAAPTTTASPSQTAADSGPSQTQAQGAVSSTPTAQATGRQSNSEGSPFENMQAAAARWSFSGPAVGLGLLAGIFIRF